jgi:two-component system, NtrC family, sensor histidine kinase HydH
LLRQHLGHEVTDKPLVAKHMDRIAGEVKRSNKTIHDLLELARNRPPRRQQAPLRTVVDNSRSTADLPSGVEVHVAIADDLAAEVDPDQLQQVLINLFTNASQAMQGAGRIDVGAERTADGGLSLRVKDNGPGIAPEVRYRIFEALFTTKAKGSGLGLALCRRILEAHGGTIEIEPNTHGASFLMTFPPVPSPEITPT